MNQFQDDQSFVTIQQPVFWGLVGLILLLAIISTGLIGVSGKLGYILRTNRLHRVKYAHRSTFNKIPKKLLIHKSQL